MAVVKNLASVMTTADITSSATSIPVNRTNVFGAAQNPLDNPFYVTIMPASGAEPANTTNSEIALVTGISGSNLIVTRGQRSTTARAFTSGAIVTNGIYAEDAVLLGSEGSAVETPAPWIESSDIKNGAVTSDKIDWSSMVYAQNSWTGNLELSTTDSKILTLNVSAFPTGAKFIAMSVVQAGGSNTATGMFTRLRYGSKYSNYAGVVTTWGKFATTMGLFTKVSGVSTVDFMAYKDNSSTVPVTDISLVAWRVA